MQRKTVLPYWLLAVALLVAALLYPSTGRTEPVFSTEAQGIKITLYTEPCTMKDQVSNLPVRATWEEKGKVYEGCAGANPNLRLFMFFFSDKSAVAVPMQVFQRVVGV